MGRFVPISRCMERRDNPTVFEKALAALVFFVGCTYETDFADCTVRCSAEIGCPDDLICGAEGFCRHPGSTTTCAMESGPLSCIGLEATCGPNHDEDCCAARQIPGGPFFRSFDVAGDGMFTSMAAPATVSPFTLDRFEVTVGRFRNFVEAGGGTRANPPAAGAGERALGGVPDRGGWESAWNANLPTDVSSLAAALQCDADATWTDAVGANEELPINCVTWYEAFAFCAWDSGFLATEAEWNFAASGGDEQRVYPWSSPANSAALDCAHANYDACGDAAKIVGSLSPAGDGRWGQADLSGNLWEWTLDWYGTYVTPCNDCADLSVETRRTNRGGGFSFAASYLRTAFRGFEAPAPAHASIGIRCGRN